jgi:hypothetical protein
MTFTNSTYATGGAALRNRATAAIEISGLPGGSAASAAFLYWAVITEGSAPLAVSSLKLSRAYPLPAASATITGVVIGTGPSPCWSGNTISVFRAGVPTSLVTGNGSYRVSIPSTPGSTGTTDGSDPWVEQELPLWEGASLAVVAPGSTTVAIYDTGLAGATLNFAFGSLSYTLDLPSQTSGGQVLIDNIGADGQIGSSRTAGYLVAQEQSYVNGLQIAGNYASGYEDSDSDWNGSSGFPLPQLWDDTGHDITDAAPYGTSALSVLVYSPYDCITAVANVVSY